MKKELGPDKYRDENDATPDKCIQLFYCCFFLLLNLALQSAYGLISQAGAACDLVRLCVLLEM